MVSQEPLNPAGKLPESFQVRSPQRVAVAPGELDCVGADWLHALELQVSADGFSPEDSLTGPLVTAA